MKALLDTSVLIAGMVEAHPHHPEGFQWLKKVIDGEIQGVVAAHSLAELYSVLSTLPVHPPLSSFEVLELIQRNIVGHFEAVPLTPQEYMEVVEHLAQKTLIGGVIYDALIMRAAIKAQVDFVVTLNPADFQRLYPQWAAKVILPNTFP